MHSRVFFFFLQSLSPISILVYWYRAFYYVEHCTINFIVFSIIDMMKCEMAAHFIRLGFCAVINTFNILISFFLQQLKGLIFGEVRS